MRKIACARRAVLERYFVCVPKFFGLFYVGYVKVVTKI